MMDLEKLKVFYMVAKHGKFIKAAQALNITQPAISRSIQLLEYSLKTRLFERSHSGVILTPSGERLYEFAKRFMEEGELVRKLMNDQSGEPAGELKIVTTAAMASIWLSEVIPGFLKQHPDIRLDIYTAPSDLEKNVNQGDILIRTRVNHHAHLIQRRILASQHQLWASEEYLKEFGTPKNIEDLDNHRLLVYEKASFNALGNHHWILEEGSNVNHPRIPYITINSIEGLIACARNGLGIIGLPDDLIKIRNTDNKLINILKEVEGPKVDIYCIYSEKMKNSRKINLFADYLDHIGKAEKK